MRYASQKKTGHDNAPTQVLGPLSTYFQYSMPQTETKTQINIYSMELVQPHLHFQVRPKKAYIQYEIGTFIKSYLETNGR
jgi:hypothetical protein